MRVVLDTNVIVAAFASRGLCAEIFETCLEGHTIVISEHILSEVGGSLVRKIHLPQNTVAEITAYLRETAEIVKPETIKSSACRDKDDLKILGTAVSGNADIIITGDKDFLVLNIFKQIEIVTPRGFWDRLRK